MAMLIRWSGGAAVPRIPTGKEDVSRFTTCWYSRPKANRDAPEAHSATAGSSDQYFIEEPQTINIEPGPGQLLLVSGRYYDADQGKTSCLLGPVGEQFDCWPSGENARIVEQNSRKRKKPLPQSRRFSERSEPSLTASGRSQSSNSPNRQQTDSNFLDIWVAEAEF